MLATNELQAAPKDLVILDEQMLLRSKQDESSNNRCGHPLDLSIDSYIIVFTGRRGGGKTTCMTYMAVMCAVLWNMRLIANYPIEFILRRYRPDGKTYLQHVKAEPLDFYKLMTFDKVYQNCLILIDEAPDIISYMASQSWKNRLFEAFVRQLRKNRNSLMMGAQDFELIDKAARWQTDIEVQCKDVARFYGNQAYMERGEEIETRWIDNSGMWTGRSVKERLYQGLKPYVLRAKVFPRVLWGDKDAGTKPVYDTFFTVDILDSLRKVDLRLSKVTVGDDGVVVAGGDKYPVSPDVLTSALSAIEAILSGEGEQKAVYQTSFYSYLPGIGDRDKNNLSKVLGQYNIGRGQAGDGKRFYDFINFDITNFRQMVKQKTV